MRYRDSQLHNLPVMTESGKHVGKLSELIIDADSHEVIQYVVLKAGTLKILLPKEFLVHRLQVVSINDERIVIKDAAVTEAAAEETKRKVSKPVPNPAGLQRDLSG
jgi:sporulation protein YlmC with PRC-barrel domain